jgi:hypothetical protein
MARISCGTGKFLDGTDGVGDGVVDVELIVPLNGLGVEEMEKRESEQPLSEICFPSSLR